MPIPELGESSITRRLAGSADAIPVFLPAGGNYDVAWRWRAERGLLRAGLTCPGTADILWGENVPMLRWLAAQRTFS